MRKAVGRVARFLFYRPPYVRRSAQTVYKALQGCVSLWKATDSKEWFDRSKEMAAIVASVQLDDGGFDVGYDYSFGMRHRRGTSVSCENAAIIALSQFAKETGLHTVDHSIKKGVNSILGRSRNLSAGVWAIPYDPHATSEIAVINATSFSAAALCLGCSQVGFDGNSKAVYTGMVRYLEDSLRKDPSINGSFWPYYDPSWAGVSPEAHTKIDLYHQMQQVEVHSLAEASVACCGQRGMVRQAADYVADHHIRLGIIPYCTSDRFFDGNIHVWGLASVVPGFLEASTIVTERASEYRHIATQTLNWLVDKVWNGKHFADIVSRRGDAVTQDYMVRSDAWVFQALASYIYHTGDTRLLGLAEVGFEKMKSVQFSGPEKHGKRQIQGWLEKFQKR